MNSTTNFNHTLKALFGAICLGLFFGGITPANAAGRQVLRGHVPREVKELNLQPIGRLAATQHLALGIALSPRNQAELAQLVKDIYDPASPRFHKYQSVKENADRFGATPADFQAVVDHLKARGLTVTATYSNRLYASVDGTVDNIEKAFHVTMRVYQHPTEARTFYAPDVEPSLDLDVPVEGINGLANYHLPRIGQTGTGSGPGSTFRGSDFRHAYAPNVTNTGTGQTIGLYCGSTAYSPKSIYVYETNCGLSTDISVKPVSVGGFNTNFVSTNNDGEQCLDIEMCISMAPGASVREYETGDFGAALSLMQSENLCKQMSTSITFTPPPSGGESTLELMASQGQSFFCASGDSGAIPATTATNWWPSYSSNVTVVGGTQLTTATPGGAWQSEIAWPGSSGGICDNVTLAEPIPLWQSGVNMSLNQGSTSYRNIPDVSMVGASFWLVFSNAQNIGPIDGTSGASPLWAGFTALVNQQAAIQGLPTIGFLNPTLYSIGNGPFYTDAFHDITNGNNTWSNSTSAYYATNGYDLVTGWGTPNGIGMINALLSYEGAIWVDFNYTGSTQNGTYNYPFQTLAQGVSAVSTGGTIWIRTAGASSETPTISKALTIRANMGTATIGN
jgi:subtilase family serine protease